MIIFNKQFQMQLHKSATAFLLYVKSEKNDVSVLHHVVLTLATIKTCLARRRHSAALNEIIIGNYLCTYKSALKITMYLSCRARRFSSSCYRPSTNLLRSCSKVAYKSKERVALLNKSVKSALLRSISRIAF